MLQYKLARTTGLLLNANKYLEEVGPNRFWKGAGEREQKEREALIAFFFIFGLKKLTGLEWWHLQKQDVIFPDFDIASFGGNSNEPLINILQFELVTIPVDCKDLNEAYLIVRSKFNKGYALSEGEVINLLVFINHEKSEEWLSGLILKIGNYLPFKEIWISYLLFKNENIWATKIVRIRPLNPYMEKTVEFTDPDVNIQAQVPDYFEINKDGNYEWKEEVRREIRKKALRKKLGK